MAIYYRLLGVERTATPEEIKRAYRRLARKFHPDTNSGHPLAEQRFRLIAEAYGVLSDDHQRTAYDRYGVAALVRRPRPGFAGGVERFISTVGELVESRTRRQPRRGQDTHRDLEVSLADACLGARHTLRVTREGPCTRCGGGGATPGSEMEVCHVCDGRGDTRRDALLPITERCPFCRGDGRVALSPCDPCGGQGRALQAVPLSIDVPPGVETGRSLLVRGYGEAGANGGPDGDLYVRIAVAPHPLLERRGADLHCEIPLTLTEAVLGGEVPVPLLSGNTVQIRVAPGARSGQTLRVRARGAPRPDGSRGDLFVRLRVDTPMLSSDRSTAVAALHALETHTSYPEREAYERRLGGQ